MPTTGLGDGANWEMGLPPRSVRRYDSKAMSEYRRWREPGATYFFTVVTANRRPIFENQVARSLLRRAIAITNKRWPFELWAAVLLPDHLHCLWTLPAGDADFSKRWSAIKRMFSQQWIASGETVDRSDSERRHRELGVWQRRFWEHLVRDEREKFAIRDYIHLNPVKHGYVNDPTEWPWSSVHRHLRQGWLSADWTSWTQINVDARAEP